MYIYMYIYISIKIPARLSQMLRVLVPCDAFSASAGITALSKAEGRGGAAGKSVNGQIPHEP